jgi:Tfp pilus assembly protein PilO
MSSPSPTMTVLRRPRVLMVCAGVLLAVLIWAIAFFVPQGAKLSSLQAQEQSLQQQVDAGNARVARLRAESQHSAQIAAMVQKLQAYAPATSDISYIAMLSNAAKATGMTVASIGPGTATPLAGSSFDTVPVSAQVKGTYDQLLSFLRAVYALPRLTDINSVQIVGGGPKTNRAAVLTATLQLEIFTSKSGSGS